MSEDKAAVEDRRAAAFLAAAGLLFFAPFAARAGLHLDDHGFVESFASADARALWRMTVEYVPGRNLYIPYFWLLYKACAGSAAAMHAVGLLLDLLNPLLLFRLARRLGADTGRALAAAGLFLVLPNHGETHWWTSSVMMNLFSTTLVLAAFLAAAATERGRGARLALAAALYVAALFDYDAVFFLWIPLLAFARWADPRLRAHDLAAGALAFGGLNALHLAARLFWPWSSGGRPVPRFDVFASSLRGAVAQTLLPAHRLPRLSGSPWGWAAACAAALAAGAVWAALCARRWDAPPPAERARAEKRLLLFGALWWLLSYFPNFFWYISPRHNYLPSAGTALAAAALGSRLASRRSLRGALAALAALAFGLGGVYAWAEGRFWAQSTALQEAFVAAARPVPDGARAVFLVGAPKTLGGAPAFFQPQEALRSLRRAGAGLAEGDVSVAAGAASLFYGGQVELFGDAVGPAAAPPAASVVYAYRGGDRFERVCALRLTMPGTAPRELAVGGGCPGVYEIAAPVLLLSSRLGARSAPSADGPALQAASLKPGPDGTLDLGLSWRAGRAPADFAFYARLLDAGGRELYRSSWSPSRQEHEALWPLYDDSHPPARWRPGETVAQEFRLRPRAPLAGRPAVLRVSLFAPARGAQWEPAGAQEVRL